MLNILTLSGGAWDDRNSVGNTYSNLFADPTVYQVSNIYTRAVMPNNQVCKHYFRITAKMLMLDLFSPQKIGKAFQYDKQSASEAEQEQEKALIAAAHKYDLRFLYVVEELLWQLRGWQNRNLAQFVAGQSPDIIFSFAIPSVQRLLMLQYLKKTTNAKIVLFLVDHVCWDYLSSSGRSGKKQAARLREMFSMADKVYGITDELCKVYGKTFGCEMSLLRKGCTFTAPVKTSVNMPVRIVYAGNLLYGRLDTLAALAETLHRINAETPRFQLEIYSATDISDENKRRIDIPGTSAFCGPRQYEEVRRILQDADMVLHVESFQHDQIEAVRYSFSTKITDCLESGSVLTVIGPAGISSVEESRRIPGIIVIDDLARMHDIFSDLAGTAESLADYAAASRKYAEVNYHIDTVRRRFRNDLQTLCGQ